jgi:threonine aldolase
MSGYGSSTDREKNEGRPPVVDLRSDTLTKPTPEMRRAMAEAEVGDDVYGEDPTINRLEARAAEIFGREAALYVPTGSMGNAVAMRVHCRSGQEVICEEKAHIFSFEMAAISAVAGCLARPVRTPDGILRWPLVKEAIRLKQAFRAPTGLIECENTHNMAGGQVMPTEIAEEICDGAQDAGIPVHLDGARIFNAATALGKDVREITRKFDSIMFCLSKGLGAPVGSMLVGKKDWIAEARLQRKVLGGGMRQAGVLAAAGLVALEKSPSRLHVDHENARLLAEGVGRLPGVALIPPNLMTNILIFDVAKTEMTAEEFSQALAAQGVRCHAITPTTIRMVTHCDVDRAGCQRAVEAAERVVRRAVAV